MAPKGKPSDAVAKKVEDKTFGMKNKNKSKQVQMQIHQMKQSAGIGDDARRKVRLPRHSARRPSGPHVRAARPRRSR